MRRLTALLLLALPVAGLAGAAGGDYVKLPGPAGLKWVLQYEDSSSGVRVAPFELMGKPVTNAQFLAFVTAQPQWRRDRVPSVFAETRYLSQWQGGTALGAQGVAPRPGTVVRSVAG